MLMEKWHVMIDKCMVFLKDLIILDLELFHWEILNMRLLLPSRKGNIKKESKDKKIVLLNSVSFHCCRQ